MSSFLFILALLADSNSDAGTSALAGAFAAFGFIWLLVCLGLLILGLVINWKIAEKAGFSGAASLLMLIPLVNLIVLIYFAFTEWPIQRAMREAGVQAVRP
jgi:glucan phosphoethanolaminetransferase (alkaline phosphatase superfamily)